MMPPVRAWVHRIRSRLFQMKAPLLAFPEPLLPLSFPTFQYLEVILIPLILPHSSEQSYTAPWLPLLSPSSSLCFRPLWSPSHCCVKINNKQSTLISPSCDYDVSKMEGITSKVDETRIQAVLILIDYIIITIIIILYFLFWKGELSGKESKKFNKKTVTISI